MSDAAFETMRPVLVSVDGDERVRVALEHRTELFVVEHAVDHEGSEARARASAEAATTALGQLTPSAVQFSLEWFAVLETSEGLPPVAVALVGVDVAGALMRYAGAAVLRGDPALAAAKAVLDALNRRLGVTGL